LTAANSLWQRWQTYRADWISLDAHWRELCTSLPQGEVRTSTFGRSVQDALSDIEAALATSVTPERVQVQLRIIRDAIATFVDLRRELRSLEQEITVLKTPVAALLQSRLTQRMAELSEITIANVHAWAQLRTALNEDRAAILQVVQEQMEAGETVFGASPREGEPATEPLPSEIRPLINPDITNNPRADSERASRRLGCFTLTSIVIMMVVLVCVGFNQLYAANLTFGVNPWLDYPALIFWALGIEGSREAVRGLVAGRPTPTPGV
jgi:hypothetical protein